DNVAELSFALGGCGVEDGGIAADEPVQGVLWRLNSLLPELRILSDQFVGVFAARDVDNAEADIHFAGNGYGPLGGAQAGFIGIKTEADITCKTAESLEVLLGQRRACRGHHLPNTRLVAGDNIEIAFTDDHKFAFANGFFSQMQTKDMARLVIE